jgi:hypothetical protein
VVLDCADSGGCIRGLRRRDAQGLGFYLTHVLLPFLPGLLSSSLFPGSFSPPLPKRMPWGSI